MLKLLQRHLYPSTPCIISQWTQYIEDLQYRKNELRRRFINNYGYESRALRIMKMILGQLDLDYLSKQNNDFDCYINYFGIVGPNFDYIFNPTKHGKAYRKTFYKKSLFSTNEYICPTNDVDHIKILPLGESWDVWRHVKPVTLWYHDSIEYSLNLIHNQVTFKYIQPTYAVIFIDSVALSMMYYKYINTPILTDDDKTPHTFLHRYVISKLFDDLQDIWLLNKIIEQIRYIDLHYDEDIIIPQSDHLYGFRGGREKEATDRLHMRLLQIKDGNLRANNLLSSNLLVTGSILNKIQYGFTNLDTENLKQYEYTRIIRDMHLLNIIYTLHSWRPDSAYYKSFRQELRIIIKRYYNSKPWSTIIDSVMKNTVKSYIQELYDKLF